MAKTARLLAPPGGFRYEEKLLTPSEQASLVLEIERLDLIEFEFHGYLGKRRTKSFGWHYSFAGESLNQSEPIPKFMLPIREEAAAFAGLEPQDFPRVLVTEYSPGTPIG